MAAEIPASKSEPKAPPARRSSAVTLEDVKNTVPEFVAGMLKGNSVDVLGMPVDMINEVLKTVGLGTSTPYGGSDFLRGTIGLKPQAQDTAAEVGGSFVSPIGVAKAMVVGAARVLKQEGRAPEVISKIIQTAKDASAMEMAGVKADVFNTTGAFAKNTDDVVRAVISDQPAKLKSGTVTREFGTPSVDWKSIGSDDKYLVNTKQVTNLEDILQHDQLFALYPELKSVKVRSDPTAKIGSAQYLESNKVIEMGPQPSTDVFLSTLLHETQHAVQGVEDMARGGSQTEFYKYKVAGNEQALANLRTRAEKDPDPSIRAAAQKTLDKVNANLRESYQKYLDIPGETEARFTQKTQNLSQPELDNKVSRLLAEDVPNSLWDQR